MANLNKVLLIGRLTRDPELKYVTSGRAVAEFGLAVNRAYMQEGEWKEETCFLEINAWGRLGERVQKDLYKGRQIFVEGRLTYHEWQNQDGQKRSRIRVTANNIQFLDRGRTAGSAGRAEKPESGAEYGGGAPSNYDAPSGKTAGEVEGAGGAGGNILV